MGKLVRDRIPVLFGGTSRPLNPAEFRAALRAKLGEEVAEYLETGEVLELADVLEVVYALAELDGVSRGELEDLRVRKAEERGAFAARLWWDPPST
ncbi:nucleoside triphosphate pyrophosphohydrolase [Deinococcus frigens]|uniref:nucleoside triphosphate pyrophosphohydrolase n=1 Tax=Deinococcus frigens TaxID=249403 RepID=UPI00049523A3|nr:nucleoside triphosphate pyrophosphohydrolase [Deinococcus frigens]